MVSVESQDNHDWIAQQIRRSLGPGPALLDRGRDSVRRIVTRRGHAMAARDKLISADSPWQSCLERSTCGGGPLEFIAYYNGSRTQHSLSKDAPFHRAIERIGTITSHPILGGLYYQISPNLIFRTHAETCVRRFTAVSPPPACSIRRPRNVQKRPETSSFAYPAKPPPMGGPIMKLADRVLHNSDESCVACTT